MSLFRARESRDAFPYPFIPTPGEAGLGQSIRRVDLTRAQSSLQKGAVFAAVNLLASMVQTIELQTFTGDTGATRKPVKAPRWFNDLGGEGYGTPDWLYTAVLSAALRGNAIGLIGDRDPRTGQPSMIDLQHPDDVHIREEGGRRTWYIKGKETPSDLIWHWRRYPFAGQTMGLSPIALHATTIGLGLSAQNFGAQWFMDGAHPSAVLTNERVSNIDKAQADTVKARFMNAVRGTREPVVLGGGWKYTQVQIAPAESQFLETQKYTEAACARIYGPGMPEVLGYDTGGSMTYANIEQRSIDLLQFTFDPWLVAVERFMSALLPQPWYARFNRKQILQTDVMTRFQAHRLGLITGALTVNEVRDEEYLPAVEWGDTPYLPAFGPAPAAKEIEALAAKENPVPTEPTPQKGFTP